MTASEVSEPVPVKLTKEEKKAAKAAKKAAKAEKKAAKEAKKAAKEAKKAATKKRKAAESNSDDSSDEDEPEQKKAKVESEPEQEDEPEEAAPAVAAVATTEGKSTGTVAWFNAEKGFGFISPTDGSKDLFVHQSSIHAEGGFRALGEGEEVEYTVETGNNGKLCAKNVTGPGGAAVKGDGQGGNDGYQKEQAPRRPAAATSEGKISGTVNWFNSEKGFGFISPTDGSTDLFVHQSSIYSEGFRSLAEGEEVEYTIETGNNGKLCAKNVTGPGGVAVKGDGQQGGNGGYQQGGRGNKRW